MENPPECQAVYRVCIAMFIWEIHSHFWGYRLSGLLYFPPFALFSFAYTDTSHSKVCLFSSSALNSTIHFNVDISRICRWCNFSFLISVNGTTKLSVLFLPPEPTAGNICGQVMASVKILKGRQEFGYEVPASFLRKTFSLGSLLSLKQQNQ